MSDVLEQRLKGGDASVFGELFTIHQPRIWQIIHFRLQKQVRGRVDPDDVVQEVYIAAKQRLEHFSNGNFPSLFLWLRLVAGQTLSNIHRTHLGTEARSVLREANPIGAKIWGNTSLCLSQKFIAHMTSPSQAAVRREMADEIRQALDGMNEIDREVLALRHFEELTNKEVGIELGITSKAASIRYMRALERLRTIIEKL